MAQFFSLSIKLSNLLSFKAKFLLVSLFCIIPLLFFFFTLTKLQWQQVERANYKLNASTYIVPLRQLVEHVAQTRGMTNVYLNGNKSVANKIMAKRQVVESNFAQLLSVESKLGEALGSNNFPASLKKRWTTISSNAFNTEANEVFSLYTLLIADIIDFMDTIGRQGKMLQDEDAANSYLINSLLHTIPAQVESLGRLRGKGSGVLAANALTTDNKLQVAALSSTRNEKILQKDMHYLFLTSAKLKSALQQPYQDAEMKLDKYLTFADKAIIHAEKVATSPEEFFAEGTRAISSLLALCDAMQPLLEQRMVSQIKAAEANINFYLLIIILVIALLTYFYIGIYLSIKQSLTSMTKTAHAICDGELDTRLSLETKDELQVIAQCINEITEGLSRSIIAVRASSQAIANAADEIACESKMAADGMETQSQELAITATAVTQMSVSVQEVAKNTELSSVSSQRVSEEVIGGIAVVSTTVEAITQLAENINISTKGIHKLEENSHNITNILDVIKSIADQTNLLALNAAIEAARAGDQGRGFSVVADEVRTLAQRTQDSTLEIQTMIELIQAGISEVSLSMEQSQEFANNSVLQVEQTGKSLSSIATSVNEINDMSIQIATATEEQSCVAEEISQSIVTISDVADSASKGAKTLALTGCRLSAMSKEMRLVIQRYTIDVDVFTENEQKLRLVHWEPKSIIGIDEADRQHEKMIDMINDVHIMSNQKRSSAAITNAISALLEYAKVHFSWEEDLFDSYNYAKALAHKESHQKLINKMIQHIDKINIATPSEISAQMKEFNMWLKSHIEHDDTDYAKFIKNQQD
ncbi:bacteriohemerythrin [Colwellia sp. 20A7]|uniref:bacteriohemerythrin n=1 Tax=Colwellia sp. 20A7 TaxID=2689569 RepID=UPI001356D423|nr:bacteriohemerythrin [Colwellia sp. 20A7]